MYNIDHRYMRPIKAQGRISMETGSFPERADLRLWTGRDAAILPLRENNCDEGPLFGWGGVVDAAGQYVSMSAIDGRVDGAYEFENAPYVDEKVVYCGYLVPQWGHFLVEGICRLWYFLEKDESVDRYVFLIEEGSDREIRGNYRSFLELLGIWDKLTFLNAPTRYREVIVPELSYKCQTYWSKNFRNLYDRVCENMVPDPSWETPEKIYFSRSQLKKQGNQLDEYGYEALDDFYARNGYLRLFPEKVPLPQMIHYLQNAKVVATYSGSVAHNLYFAPLGQRLEVLERCVTNDDHQVDLDRIKELNAVYIDANLPLYTTDFGGPFIMAYNDNMARYAEDNGLVPPSEAYFSEKYRRACFAGYMRSYWDQYRMRWFMLDWYPGCTDMLVEGYNAGYAWFHEYLDGEKPYFWYHSLYPHYIKQFIKRLLRKLGLYK